MATYRKTKSGKWRVEVYHKGQRKSKVCLTKTDARHWANQVEYQLVNRREFIARSVRVADLFRRYIKEICPMHKGGDKETIRLKKFCTYPLADFLASEVTAKDIAKWRDMRLKEVSPASVNREMNTLSAVFRLAMKDWELVEYNPCSGVTRPRQPKPRDRRISDDEVNRILSALGYVDGFAETKQHQVAVMFLIALETAMRLGEIHGLKHENLFLDKRYLTLEDTKNNDKRYVPLSKRAVKLVGLLGDDLITVPKGSVTTLFRKAVKRAEIENLRFHDSRHEAITRLARKLDVLDLARMIGHRDPRSLMIYYNATAEEIASRLD